MPTWGAMFMQEITTQKLTQDMIPTLIDSGFTLYLVIESMDVTNISELIKNDEKEALFINTRFSSVMDASPYVVCLNDINIDLLNHILKELSGIIIVSTLPLNEVRHLLSHYLEVNSEELGATYLRFYSPSVCVSLLKQQPEIFYGFSVISPLMTRNNWGYSNFQQYDLKKKTTTITDHTTQIMMLNRWGAWLSSLPTWQQKTTEDISKGSETIETLVSNQLRDQMLLEKWRTLLADNIRIIGTAEFQELLRQPSDEDIRYDAVIQLIAAHQFS
jgi:hypothetical protein